MVQTSFVAVLNIWHSHSSNLHELLSFLVTHEKTRAECPSTPRLDNPKALAYTGPSNEGRISASMVEPSPTGLD